MAREVKKTISRKQLKKEVKKEIYEKLMPILAEYKDKAEGKKFDRKLQKASKLFVPLALKAKSTTIEKKEKKASA